MARRQTLETPAAAPGAAPALPPRGARRWLLLVHQLPPKPTNLRVRTWRRLQQLGAIAVKQAVYVLPDSPVRARRLRVAEDGDRRLRRRGDGVLRQQRGCVVGRCAGRGVQAVAAGELCRAGRRCRAAAAPADHARPRAQRGVHTRARVAAIAGRIPPASDRHRGDRLLRQRRTRSRGVALLDQVEQRMSSSTQRSPRRARAERRHRREHLPQSSVGDASAAGRRSHVERVADHALHRSERTVWLRARSRRRTARWRRLRHVRRGVQPSR